MKKLILLLASILLVTTLNSCTADELPTKEEKNQATNYLNRDGDPPPIIIIKP